MTPKDFSIRDISVGQKASFTRTLTSADVEAFAKLSGDTNPLHLDEVYAKTTQFKKPIVHGMLVAALCSQLIGMHLPGKRSLYLSQTLTFKEPVYIDDELLVEGEVKAKSDSVSIVELFIIIRQGEDVVLEGVAKVKVL